jgi:hypothetical protein
MVLLNLFDKLADVALIVKDWDLSCQRKDIWGKVSQFWDASNVETELEHQLDSLDDAFRYLSDDVLVNTYVNTNKMLTAASEQSQQVI